MNHDPQVLTISLPAHAICNKSKRQIGIEEYGVFILFSLYAGISFSGNGEFHNGLCVWAVARPTLKVTPSTEYSVLEHLLRG